MLRRQFPGVEAPAEAGQWSQPDLEAFFASGGAWRPKLGKGPARSRSKAELAEATEFDVPEALQLQQQLRDAVAEDQFQTALKLLKQKYPERRTKGHGDFTAYFEAFEALALAVHARVLPEWGLEPGWDGVREMITKMADALNHPKVKKLREELNVLMGLPRDANFAPPKEANLMHYMPGRDAPPVTADRPMVQDEDGDEAHEFLVEGADGELRQRGPTSLDDELWYQVTHSPAVVIREQPDEKSKMVGRRKVGRRIRIMGVVGDKWLQLHHLELVKLGVQQAFVLLDGSEMGLPGEKLLAKVR